MMAGRSIGMSKWKIIWHVTLPQVLRLAIPARWEKAERRKRGLVE
jgi:ABC-type amino acid transport system permease subunit